MRRGALGAFAGVLLLLFAAGSATSASTTAHAKPHWRATVATLPANESTELYHSVNIPSISCASAGNCAAVGSYAIDGPYGSCGDVGLVLTEKKGHWATGVEVLPPADVGVNCPEVWLRSVSCPSPGQCVAVGSSDLLVTEEAGHWVVQDVALPTNAAAGSGFDLTSVSCGSAGNCTAVGTYSGRGLLLTETGGHWARGVEAPLPPGASGGDIALSSVSCAADGSCSAVGLYDGDFPSRGDASGKPLLLTNAGGAWHAVEAVMPPDGPGEWSEVLSVACASGGNCSAIGMYNVGIDSQRGPESALLTEKAGKWGRGVKAKPPKNAATSGFWAGGYSALSSLSCASPGNCVAVGRYVDNHDRVQGLIVTERAGKWRSGVEAALPRNARRGSLGVVSCASPGNCTAAGNVLTAGGGGGSPIFLIETAGSWAQGVKAPRTVPYVSSVSCSSSGICGAAGGCDGCIYTHGWVLFDSSTKSGSRRRPGANFISRRGP